MEGCCLEPGGMQGRPSVVQFQCPALVVCTPACAWPSCWNALWLAFFSVLWVGPWGSDGQVDMGWAESGGY